MTTAQQVKVASRPMLTINYVPGFCINTEQRDSASFLERWVTFFGGRIEPGDERSMITFIIERLDRDLRRLDLYAPTIRRLGFRLHVRINDASLGADMVQSIRTAYPWATVALGNSKKAGGGLQLSREALDVVDVLEDDAGIGSAVQMAKRAPGEPVAFHTYGDKGFQPWRHLGLLREWYPDHPFLITEGAWGHDPTATKVREDIHSAAAGLWARELLNAAEFHKIPVSLFRGVDFFQDGSPTPALIALRDGGYVDAQPLRAWHRPTTISMHWRRLIG